MQKIIDTSLLILGLALFVYGGHLLSLRYRPLPVVQAHEQVEPTVTDLPTKIEISSLSLSLPVYPASIVGDKWQTTDSGISYLSSSPLPGTVGNSVMYGHNWPNLLHDLGKVKPGDTIAVFFGSKKLIYSVHYVSVVEPDNTSVYTNTTDARLTLYTCTGLLDSKRLVVTAILLQ